MDRLEALLKDSMTEIAQLLDSAAEKAQNGDSYERGRKMGLMEAISVVQQYARNLGVERSKLALPERDIVDVMLERFD